MQRACEAGTINSPHPQSVLALAEDSLHGINPAQPLPSPFEKDSARRVTIQCTCSLCSCLHQSSRRVNTVIVTFRLLPSETTAEAAVSIVVVVLVLTLESATLLVIQLLLLLLLLLLEEEEKKKRRRKKKRPYSNSQVTRSGDR